MKKVLILLIMSLGLFLRVTGADWGFPLLLHPDEHTIADVPADMARRSSLDPAVYMRPDHIEIYANAVLYHAASIIKYGKPLTDTFGDHKTFYYLLSRILVALLGTACIAVAYLIGREYGEGTGIAASLIFAIFPAYVGHSHYITSDVPLTLCILCSILIAIRYLKGPTNRKLILLSLSSAFALSVKYPGVLTVLLTMAVILSTHYEDKRKAVRELLKALLLFLFFAFIISPYLFINYREVIAATLIEARQYHVGADELGWIGNMIYYAKCYYAFTGILMFPFFLLGAFYVIRTEKKFSIPLFFGFLYWIILSNVPLHWERWALPMFTAPLLITAYGVNIAGKGSLFASRKFARPASNLAFGIALCKLLVVSTVIAAMFTLRDTREVSYQFVREAGITQENALYEGYTPLSPGRPRALVKKGDVIEDKSFIILSSYTYKRYLNDKERFERQNKFYDQLFSLPLVREFAPVSENNFADLTFWANKSLIGGIAFLKEYFEDNSALYRGPTIRIYSFNE
jgi:hypothetical protein